MVRVYGLEVIEIIVAIETIKTIVAIEIYISTFNFQLSIFNFQFSIFNFQFSTFNFQFSIFNFQLSTFNLSYIFCQRSGVIFAPISSITCAAQSVPISAQRLRGKLLA